MSRTPSAARISLRSVEPKTLHPGQVDMKNSVICTLGGAEAARVLTSKLNIIIIISRGADERPRQSGRAQQSPSHVTDTQNPSSDQVRCYPGL